MSSRILSHQLITGLSFSSTSAVISTLGVIVGVEMATSSKLAVVSAIIVMAVADGLSDAMGIHLSEEAEHKHTPKEVWLSTIFTFLGVCGFTLTFVIPVLLFSFPKDILISVIWGLGILSLSSFYIAKTQNRSSWKIILEHNLIAIAVIIISYYLGILLKIFLG